LPFVPGFARDCGRSGALHAQSKLLTVAQPIPEQYIVAVQDSATADQVQSLLAITMQNSVAAPVIQNAAVQYVIPSCT
jgi:hypothetical protein